MNSTPGRTSGGHQKFTKGKTDGPLSAVPEPWEGTGEAFERKAPSFPGGLQMQKIDIGNNVFPTPMPVVLVGSRVEGKVNFMAVGWVSRVNSRPPMVGIGINKVHYTPKGILENRAFSINVPGTDMVTVTDYCGLVSGKTTDKSVLFEVFYGELDAAPMIASCPLTLECRLTQTVDLPSNYFFIGEIVSAHCGEAFLKDGKPDMAKIDPLLLTMPDNRYWAVGKQVATAWSAGKALK
jgi:flavin reductase (DIM6/NTAB) family NADH-FMN oxidoreductase RutF